jgi:hemoglobin-like flavoprotein
LAENKMTPEQVKLVTDGFRKVLPIAGVTADLFYDRLFEIAPEVRLLFLRDLVEQKKKFITMLAAIVTHLDDFKKIAPVITGLGQRHIAYGVIAKHYEPFGVALLWTLAETLGVDFTPAARTAWTAAYRNLADVMMGAADSLPPPALAC